jgi:microcystin-dependent protein
MAQPYVGEIRMFAGTFAPAGWMLCSGQNLPIAENEVLFQVIGTTYGGDGQQTFNLPNIQSRVPVHQGTGPGLQPYQLAEQGGAESVTLTTNQIPVHNHAALGSLNTADSTSPANAVPGTLQVGQNQLAYGTDAPVNPLDMSSLSPDGGSQPHDNLQPYGTLNYIISLYGIFPSATQG